MRYVSTRGAAPVQDFTGVLLTGLAPDGGLYWPEEWPRLSPGDWQALRGLPYPQLAARLLAPFVGDAIDQPALDALVADAYAGFRHECVVPLVQLTPSLFVLELFHGPTLAFKDLALQILGRLFDHVLAPRGRRITIVGATSGDTGSAAIAALANRASVDLVILHPHERVSEVQRRQMTTVKAPNIRNIAVTGSFDDCQDIVKTLLNDAALRDELRLSAVNSINFMRIAAQIPYYAAAALALGAPQRAIEVAVPTGNFGNVLAAYAAKQMGLPIARAIVASNHNDILTRFLAANDMRLTPVQPSHSPSMDIQVSSNFERLLFDLLSRDGARVGQIMQEFRDTGTMPVPEDGWYKAREFFVGQRCDNDQTVAEMRDLMRRYQYLADPHSAIGIAAARAQAAPDQVTMAIATAHPAKFPDIVRQATGVSPALPPALRNLFEESEHYHILPPDAARIATYVREFSQRTLTE